MDPTVFPVVIALALVVWAGSLIVTVYREFFGWSHIYTSFGEEPFSIEGIDVWSDKWIETGKTVKVRDPLYGEQCEAEVYEMAVGDKRVSFASAEYSNGVYGFYRRKRDLPRAKAPKSTVRY